MSKFSDELEKKISGKINAIAKGTETAKGAGVNDLIKKLKKLDEAAAEELQKKYIVAVKKAAEDNK
jgi:hypothetical protein